MSNNVNNGSVMSFLIYLNVIGNIFYKIREYNFIVFINIFGIIKCGLFYEICGIREIDRISRKYIVKWS